MVLIMKDNDYAILPEPIYFSDGIPIGLQRASIVEILGDGQIEIYNHDTGNYGKITSGQVYLEWNHYKEREGATIERLSRNSNTDS